MDTIRSYIDNMFLGYPQNENTIRAKEELFSMMEDKYYELKESGKSENEAVGIVISEFGNLEEVSEALGFEPETEEHRTISLEETRNCLLDVKQYWPKVVLGIAIIISSASILMFMLGGYALNVFGLNEEQSTLLALLFILVFVAIGVYLIVSNYMQLSAYKFLDEEVFHLDYQSKQEINHVKAEADPKFKKALSLSVVMYILSVVPMFASLIIFGEMNEGPLLISLGILILIVSFSTYNLLMPYGVYNATNKLLGETAQVNPKLERISTIYWTIVIALYLGYSFITMNWGYSWIIWPVAGVLYAAVEAFFDK